MSEHKTGKSNWTDDQKGLYWQRREKGLRGQIGVVTVHQRVKDEEGNDQHVALGNTTGSRLSVRKSSDARSNRRLQQRAFVRQLRRASARGE